MGVLSLVMIYGDCALLFEISYDRPRPQLAQLEKSGMHISAC